jgi:hypothetical protein
MKNVYRLLAVFALLTQISLAGTKTCSSSDQRLSFIESSPDGGANIGRSLVIKLEGITVIQISPHTNVPIPKVNLAEGEFSGKVMGSIVTVSEDAQREISYGYQRYILKEIKKPFSVLFDGYVFCETSRHVGMPIPQNHPGGNPQINQQARMLDLALKPQKEFYEVAGKKITLNPSDEVIITLDTTDVSKTAFWNAVDKTKYKPGTLVGYLANFPQGKKAYLYSVNKRDLLREADLTAAAKKGKLPKMDPGFIVDGQTVQYTGAISLEVKKVNDLVKAEGFLKSQGFTQYERISYLPNSLRVYPNVPFRDLMELVKSLSEKDFITYAEPDLIVQRRLMH